MKKQIAILTISLFAFLWVNANPFPATSAKAVEKTNQQNHLSRTTGGSIELMRLNMYGYNTAGAPYLVDGTLTQYAPEYSNDIDGKDARKMVNPAENIGLIRNDKLLIVERRQTIEITDTIFFKIWNMQKRSYQLEFVGMNLDHPQLEGFLEDTYLKNETPLNLNDTTKIIFDVNNDTASYNLYRFRVVFKTVSPVVLPFKFTAINAYEQTSQVVLEWNTQNENNVKEYFVQRSAEGKYFKDEAPVNTQNRAISSYRWIDSIPNNGVNYYRVRSLGVDGKTEYSNIIQTYVAKKAENVVVFPNPVINNKLNLQLYNQKKGIYHVEIKNIFGQRFISQTFDYAGGDGKQAINLGVGIPKGIYQLEIKMPGGNGKTITILVQ